nr:hypothetical protein [Tanacetum cinerariifolium]
MLFCLMGYVYRHILCFVDVQFVSPISCLPCLMIFVKSLTLVSQTLYVVAVNDVLFVIKYLLLLPWPNLMLQILSYGLIVLRSDSVIALDIMAAENVPAENVLAIAPPIRSDDQILPYNSWLDEQWFDLNEEVFRDVLGITPRDLAHPFVAPITSNALIDFFMELGYRRKLSGVSYVTKHPVLQIMWGVITETNLDFAQLLEEDFIQAIQSFISNRKKQSFKDKKKEPKTLLIPNSKFTKLIIDSI